MNGTAHGLRATLVAAAAATTLLASGGTAHAELDPGQLHSITDRYLFQTSLSDFGRLQEQRPHRDQLDWSADGCTLSPDQPLGFEFRPGCDRHDFGYRNYDHQQRLTEKNRKRIDDNFRDDLYELCGTEPLCHPVADIYYQAVRQFGGVSGSTAEALQKGKVPERVQQLLDEHKPA